MAERAYQRALAYALERRQGAALQPGDVHLGVADPGRDLILVQVLEEPQHDDLALQRREGGADFLDREGRRVNIDASQN